MAEFKRKAKILDKDGKVVEIEIDNFSTYFPIKQTKLSKEILKRIGLIYGELKPYLHTTLEQFELGFMRNDCPENEVALWEDILTTLELAKDIFEKGNEEKIFEILLCVTMNALTPEEEKDKIVKQISQLYSQVKKARQK